MPPSLIHLLTAGGQLTTTGVVCGARDAAVASWDLARVTCLACLHQCTCAPGVAVCPACRTWAQTHRADGSRKPRPALPAIRSEKQLQEVIRQAAREADFLTYHTLQSKGSEPGFPDLVLAKPHQALWFIEVKMENGRLTPAQQQWMDVLHTIQRVEAQIFRPHNLAEIREILR